MNILNYVPDVIIILVVLLSIVNGYAKGFIRTFLHAIGWILAMVLAFVWSPKIQEWLLNHTKVYANMKELLTEKFAESVPGTAATFDILPKALSKGLESFSGNITSLLTTRVADIIFVVLSFVLVVLATKLVLYILVGLLSKKNRKGLPGMVDGLLGGLAGAVTGIILVYVLLLLLIPFTALTGPELTQTISGAIDKSLIANLMYNNNLVVVIFKDFLMGLS